MTSRFGAHEIVNRAIAAAIEEGRYVRSERDGVAVCALVGMKAIHGDQIGHFGLRHNAVYVVAADQTGACDETLLRHELHELRLWQAKAAEIAGLDPATSWGALAREERDRLSDRLRVWMFFHLDEAERTDQRFHEEAERLFPVSVPPRAPKAR